MKAPFIYRSGHGLHDRFVLIAALVGASLLTFAMSLTTPAQQTVFNVPTTDVLDKGKVYFELDVSAKAV
jgi:hypothetical protein